MPSDAGGDRDAASCGHDCCGGSCIAGKCQPHVIYQGPDGAFEPLEEIAVHGAYVYFSSTRVAGLHRIPINGGPRVTIWNARPTVTSIAVDASGVYVGGVNSTADAGTSGLIERVSGDGQSTVMIDTGQSPTEIALDSTHAYWQSGSSLIKRWPKSGAAGVTVFGNEVTLLGSMTARSGRVFFHQASGGQVFQRDVLDPFSDHTLAMGESQVSSLAVNGAHVFWPLATANKIRRVAVSGTGPIDLVANAGGTPTHMAADDSHVYWISLALNAIRAARADAPGVAIDLATGFTNLRKLALDSSCVYATLGGSEGKIVRVAKP